MIRSVKNVVKKGEEIYKKKIKSIVLPDHISKFVAIEVNSGNYFLGNSIMEAIKNGKKKYPNRIFHVVKIGSKLKIYFNRDINCYVHREKSSAIATLNDPF